MCFFDRARASAAFSQTGDLVGTCGLQCRDEAKNYSGEDGDKKREQQHSDIDRDFVEPRKISRSEPQQGIFQHDDRDKSDNAGDRSQQHAFGEQLTDEPAATRPERQADCNFALASSSPRQQQVRDIDAGDQEDAADSSEKHKQFGANAANEIILNRDKASPP